MSFNPWGRWIDIVKTAIGRRLSSSSGTMDNNYTELTLDYSPNGDLELNNSAGAPFEINHFVEGI